MFLTSPNNPTGVSIPLAAIRGVARRVPREAVVFVDEAYAEFSGVSFIPALADYPNVIVGRTFSKAFGPAGLRIGAITGNPETLEPIRLVIPVYSVNIAAIVAVQAALDDLAFVERYKAEVETSKACSTPPAIGSACDTGRVRRTSC